MLEETTSRPFEYWTPEQDAELRKHWGSKSAELISGPMARTKNSVIGRAHRLGLSTPDPSAPAMRRRIISRQALGGKLSAAAANRKPLGTGFPKDGHVHSPAPYFNPDATAQVADPLDIGTVSFVDRERHQCAWPCDTGLAFCGHPKPDTDAVPYCERHHAKAHRPAVGSLSDAVLFGREIMTRRVPLARFSQR